MFNIKECESHKTYLKPCVYVIRTAFGIAIRLKKGCDLNDTYLWELKSQFYKIVVLLKNKIGYSRSSLFVVNNDDKFSNALPNLPQITRVKIFVTITQWQKSFSIIKFKETSLQRSIATEQLCNSLSCESALKKTLSVNVLCANETTKYLRRFVNCIFSPVDDRIIRYTYI